MENNNNNNGVCKVIELDDGSSSSSSSSRSNSCIGDDDENDHDLNDNQSSDQSNNLSSETVGGEKNGLQIQPQETTVPSSSSSSSSSSSTSLLEDLLNPAHTVSIQDINKDNDKDQDRIYVNNDIKRINDMVNNSGGIIEPVKTLSSTPIYFCVYIRNKKKLSTFILVLDYERREMVFSRRGKRLKSIPFVVLGEPLPSTFEKTFITIRTKEPNIGYQIYMSSKTERLQLIEYINAIIKNPIESPSPQSIDLILYEGQVFKKGKVKWAQRWIRIHPLCITLRKKQDSMFPVNVIPIQNLSVKVQETYTLLLRTRSRQYSLRASSQSLRDMIYDKLISVGSVSNNNTISSQRKLSLKLSPSVNPNLDYFPMDFTTLHNIFQQPGIDLKSLHRENFRDDSSSNNSSLIGQNHLQHSSTLNLIVESEGERIGGEEEEDINEVGEEESTNQNLYPLPIPPISSSSSITTPIYSSSNNKRKSVKELIDLYNKNNPSHYNILLSTPTKDRDNRKTFRKAVKLTNNNNNNNSNNSVTNNPNNNHLEMIIEKLKNSGLINNDGQIDSTYIDDGIDTNCDRGRLAKEVDQDEIYLIIKTIEGLNQSCDEIIEWLSTNRHLISNSGIQTGNLISETDQLLQVIKQINDKDNNNNNINIDNNDNVNNVNNNNSITNHFVDDNGSIIQIFKDVDIEFCESSSASNLSSTSTSISPSISNSSTNESLHSYSSNSRNSNNINDNNNNNFSNNNNNNGETNNYGNNDTYLFLLTPSVDSTANQDDDNDYEEEQGYKAMVAETHLSNPLLFNMSPVPIQTKPLNQCGDYSLLQHCTRTNSKEDLRRRYSRDVTPKTVWKND